MRRLLAGGVVWVAFLVIAVPGIVVFFSGGIRKDAAGGGAGGESPTIRVYRHATGRVESMALEEYVKGVLGAEMPAEFELEALKAQAVAARTYAASRMRAYGGDGAAEDAAADISTDYQKGQAWLAKEELEKRWGERFVSYWTKISRAVEETRGEIAVYDGQPIRAVFHSTSGARTASAKEVWGGDFPYLQSVECRWDQASPRYREEKTFTPAELAAALGETAVPAAASPDGAAAAEVVSLTESGRVKEARIGDRTFSGRELRGLLGLRSDCFTVHASAQGMRFETQGYGHGVGLCQYGANGMAKEGSSYGEILRYYYTGIEIKRLDPA